MDIRGKTVVITGAGRGIGRSLATCFASLGANIALIDIDKANVEDSAQECVTVGARTTTHVADVAREDQIESSLDAVVREFGALDVMINNAGIVRDALLITVRDGNIIGKMTVAQWQAVIDINLTGTFLCARGAAERMIKLSKGGVIINISSISRHGNVGQTNYSAAKAGVASMSVVWARELARYGIRVASISPGFIHTDMLDSVKPELLSKIVAPVPLARLGTANEIAHAATFIVENDFFTGRSLEVDGGLRL